MPVPFADLNRSAAELEDDLTRAFGDVLGSGSLILGPQVEAFEREFASFCEAGDAVGVASGTDAIELALRALGIGPGDEVVTQANTCVPTVAAIDRAGATPVLCDVEPEAGTIDPDSLAAAIGPKTRAVVPVHLYGQTGDLDAVLDAAGEIAVIEDCAQAHGARYKARAAGTIGTAGCFSFYPTKNLGALGDGGAIASDNGDLCDRLRLLRTYGQEDRYRHIERGVNSRLDELQAALLRVKLARLEQDNRRRAEIATIYDEALAGTAVEPLARLPDRVHAHHLYVVRAPERAAYQAELERRGIATLIHYKDPIHRQGAYRELADGPVPLRNSERFCEAILSLPLFPEMTDAEVDEVAAAASEAAG